MESNILEDNSDPLLIFSPEVQSAIEEVLPKKDPLDESDFNCIDYINSLFPTEQSLSNIDDVVAKFENKILTIDNETSLVIHGQVDASREGRQALAETQQIIQELFVHIKEIKEQAVKSEEMVREITRDIKQLDCAKKNLTLAITTLNHLHMLVGGIDNLKNLTQKRLYGEIALPLQAISEVMTYFENYSDIPQIKSLSDEVKMIHAELAEQINHDFREAFSNTKSAIPSKQLQQACLVVSVLKPSIKKELLHWFVDLQLEEYNHLFQETEDTAWLDKIDRRYAWLKRHLLDFEDKLGNMFPQNWEVSERIAVRFSYKTRDDLTKIMAKRKQEIDVKLLLYAIQKTTAFENLLGRRFTGVTILEEKGQSMPENGDYPSVFEGIIGKCFVPHLEIYIESVDSNLAELLDRFLTDEKSGKPTESTETQASILPSCPDLFVFYKKSMIQCNQLDKGKTMLNLAVIFQKYLNLYAEKLLINQLPKLESQSTIGSSVQQLTRDIQKMSTSGLIQNFSYLLKEGESAIKLNKDEQAKICCILTTAEYCQETTQQLAEKLKEKIEPASLAEQIDFTREQDHFQKVISNCIQILVQDLENACEPALTAMSKTQWQNIQEVTDQSSYVTSITNHLRNNVPIIRDNLAQSRKYFTQFCLRFANSFIPKFVQNVFKCKPISTLGAEQLLLDTHMLKEELLTLLSVGSQINRQAPLPYTKVVTKNMSKAEMIIKVVMRPLEPPSSFVDHFNKLLPDSQLSDFHKVLEMKGVKKQEQTNLLELFKSKRG